MDKDNPVTVIEKLAAICKDGEKDTKTRQSTRSALT
jgi:hypothetical protein